MKDTTLPLSAAQALAIDAQPERLSEAKERLRVKREGEIPVGPCMRCRREPRQRRSPYCVSCDWTAPTR